MPGATRNPHPKLPEEMCLVLWLSPLLHPHRAFCWRVDRPIRPFPRQAVAQASLSASRTWRVPHGLPNVSMGAVGASCEPFGSAARPSMFRGSHCLSVHARATRIGSPPFQPRSPLAAVKASHQQDRDHPSPSCAPSVIHEALKVAGRRAGLTRPSTPTPSPMAVPLTCSNAAPPAAQFSHGSGPTFLPPA
jgi:hypothetical protein